MSAFLYGVGLHWRMDLRNREVVIVYYVVPLIFFLFMGGFFSAVMPGAEQTLIQSMTVFGATMGAMIGSPAALAETYNSETRKAYRVGGVPLWTAVAANLLSSFLHLLLMSAILYTARFRRRTRPRFSPLWRCSCFAASVWAPFWACWRPPRPG